MRTGKNIFNGDHFEMEDNHESTKDEKTLFLFLLQICDLYFNHFKNVKGLVDMSKIERLTCAPGFLRFILMVSSSNTLSVVSTLDIV